MFGLVDHPESDRHQIGRLALEEPDQSGEVVDLGEAARGFRQDRFGHDPPASGTQAMPYADEAVQQECHVGECG